MTAATVARVLFDEAHSEAWTIRPELAREMQPAHPADASYARAAAGARARATSRSRANVDGPLTRGRSTAADVLVIAHPSEPKWERTTGSGSPRLSADELDAIEAFVARGGGLIVLGETEQDKYGNNLNELLARFGIADRATTPSRTTSTTDGAPSWVLRRARRPAAAAATATCSPRVSEACFYRAARSRSAQRRARARAHARRPPSAPGAPLIVGGRARRGPRRRARRLRPVRRRLHRRARPRARCGCNLVYWAAARRRFGAAGAGAPRRRRGRSRLGAAARRDRRAARCCRRPTARSTPATHERGRARTSRRSIGAIEALAPRFPHQADYLDARRRRPARLGRRRLRRARLHRARWSAFRPERHRARRHRAPRRLPDVQAERLARHVLRGADRPRAVARVARRARAHRYDNAKFVPVELRRPHRGLRLRVRGAVPRDRVASPARPVNHFGAIFCDREAERFRRVGRRRRRHAAAQPAARRRRAAGARADCRSEAYILWDLIHDRAHSHGDLPFDPFMIRQRVPYWMYSLEELRCDLTAFGEARGARGRGLRVRAPRPVRDPVRPAVPLPDHRAARAQLRRARRPAAVRLPAPPRLPALDRQPADDRVGARRRGRRRAARRGRGAVPRGHRPLQARSMGAAHDLVAAYVPPAAGSTWARGVRELRRRRGPAAVHRPRARRRVPAVDLLQLS